MDLSFLEICAVIGLVGMFFAIKTIDQVQGVLMQISNRLEES